MPNTNYFYCSSNSNRVIMIQKYNEKTFEGNQKAWDKFLKPAVIVAAPFVAMVVGAKTKSP